MGSVQLPFDKLLLKLPLLVHMREVTMIFENYEITD